MMDANGTVRVYEHQLIFTRLSRCTSCISTYENKTVDSSGGWQDIKEPFVGLCLQYMDFSCPFLRKDPYETDSKAQKHK